MRVHELPGTAGGGFWRSVDFLIFFLIFLIFSLWGRGREAEGGRRTWRRDISASGPCTATESARPLCRSSTVAGESSQHTGAESIARKVPPDIVRV